MKIAVFIDFDNIEIGVKTTLGQPFDIAAILEGIKERGEVVTKVAYGDWKRAGDHGRLLSQHAIRMVQRNLTPGGDKNGADINLALDALEMAFTHDHINAFVIVGGDSDFITLVEKLKQYDKKVFVVGGRQFTSLVMQKNCHEFIAYENLVGSSSSRRQPAAERRAGSAPAGPTDVAKALPLVKRALKVLVDREVSPQLGLLKSTLLQLDSTFSERDYGASTFRDFIEKVAQTGLVTLRHAGRSLLVDLADTPPAEAVAPANGSGAAAQAAAAYSAPEAQPETPSEAPAEAAPPESRETPVVDAVEPAQAHQAIARAQEIFQRAGQAPRWPMYVRQVKQYLRAGDEAFDERKYGFSTIVEFLRASQREGLFRLERDRQGVLRVFAGAALQRPAAQPGTPMAEAETAAAGPGSGDGYAPMADALAEAAEPVLGLETEPLRGTEPEPALITAAETAPEAVPEQEPSLDLPPSAVGDTREEAAPPASARRTRRSPASGRTTSRKSAGTKSATPRAPRARKKAV